MSIERGSIATDSEIYANRPFIDGAKMLYNGKVIEWRGEVEDVTCPILTSDGERIVLGRIAQMTADEAVNVSHSAAEAWHGGQGEWPQMKLRDRIACVEKFVELLAARRELIISTLMWEICKNSSDAAQEFDRTMLFIKATIEELKIMDSRDGSYQLASGIRARVRRAAIGIMLAVGPFNYPFNETYTTTIPALLMGNVVIMKIPAIGGLAHVLTMDAYAAAFPKGVMNFISGSGRITMTPIMSSGLIDILAFIGGSKTADTIMKLHPHPHRLKVFMSLEGKNIAVVTPDADLDIAAEQCTLGSLTFNGQRCTAIKLIFVHESVQEAFLPKFVTKVTALECGLPWLKGSQITPLAEPNKSFYLQELVDDAVFHGAKIINELEGGGTVCGAALFHPTIVGSVNSSMRLWYEEQFGPVIPIAIYSDISEVYEYARLMPYGQQAAIFSQSETVVADLVDKLSCTVGRININTQCGRSPDVFPFSGRRSSANGTLSVSEGLKCFSIETVLAGKSNDINEGLLHSLEANGNFMAPLY